MSVDLPPHLHSPFSRPVSAEFPGIHGFYIHPARTGVKGYGSPWIDPITSLPIPPPGSEHAETDPNIYTDEIRFIRKTKKDEPEIPPFTDPNYWQGRPAIPHPWKIQHRPGNWVYGNLDWMGKDEFPDPDNPNKPLRPGKHRLSFWGPQARYFPEQGFKYGYKSDAVDADPEPKHYEIYYQGKYLAVSPIPVLSACYQTAEYVDPVTQEKSTKKWLIAACLDPLHPDLLTLLIREAPSPLLPEDIDKIHSYHPITGAPRTYRDYLKLMFSEDPDNPILDGWHKSQWSLLQTFQDPGSKLSIYEVHDLDTPWHFNESGTEMLGMVPVTMRNSYNNGMYPVYVDWSCAENARWNDSCFPAEYDEDCRLCYKIGFVLNGVETYPYPSTPVMTLYPYNTLTYAYITAGTGSANWGDVNTRSYDPWYLAGVFSFYSSWSCHPNNANKYILAADYQRDEPIFLEAAAIREAAAAINYVYGDPTTGEIPDDAFTNPSNAGSSNVKRGTSLLYVLDCIYTFLVKEDKLNKFTSRDYYGVAEESDIPFVVIRNRLPFVEEGAVVDTELDYYLPSCDPGYVDQVQDRRLYGASGVYDPKSTEYFKLSSDRVWLQWWLYDTWVIYNYDGDEQIDIVRRAVLWDDIPCWHKYNSPIWDIPGYALYVDNQNTEYCWNNTASCTNGRPSHVDHFDKRSIHYMDLRRPEREWVVYTRKIRSGRWPYLPCKDDYSGDSVTSTYTNVWQLCDYERGRSGDKDKVYLEWEDTPESYTGSAINWGADFHWIPDSRWHRDLPTEGEIDSIDQYLHRVSVPYASFSGGWNPVFKEGDFNIPAVAKIYWCGLYETADFNHMKGNLCPSIDMLLNATYVPDPINFPGITENQTYYCFWYEDGELKTDLVPLYEVVATKECVTPSGFGMDDYGNKIISFRYQQKNAQGVNEYKYFNYLEDMEGKEKKLDDSDLVGAGPEWYYRIGTV